MDRYEKFYIYKNENLFLVLATKNRKTQNKIFIFDRNQIHLSFSESDHSKSFNSSLFQLARLLYEENTCCMEQRKSKSSRNSLDLNLILGQAFVCKSYGIIGFPKFIDGGYILLITGRKIAANFEDKPIFTITETKLEFLCNQKTAKFFTNIGIRNLESRYLSIFNGFHLTSGDFFFSYSFNLTKSLQKQNEEKIFLHDDQLTKNDQTKRKNENLDELESLYEDYIKSFKCTGSKERKDDRTYNKDYNNKGWRIDDRFMWNHFLLREFSDQTRDENMILPIIHGYVGQKNIELEENLLNLLIISRRSRFQAGTRYFRRGLNENGDVSNEIETEQILVYNNPFLPQCKKISSYVHYRGSIPFFWGQENSLLPKPPIIVYENLDSSFDQTVVHFRDLACRYGKKIIILNLLKKKEKGNSERLLSSLFEKFIQTFPSNEFCSLQYTSLDFLHYYEDSMESLVEELERLAKDFEEMGFFSIEEDFQGRRNLSTQKGIIRINCVDCLDRTNNTISSFAFHILLKQISLHFFPPKNTQKILGLVLSLFASNGDRLAIQYAGSEAFHKASLVETPEGDYKAKKQNKTYFAVKRYISNALLDDEKQKSISLFLGDFLPPSSSYLPFSSPSSSPFSISSSSSPSSYPFPPTRSSFSLLTPRNQKHLWELDMKELAEKVRRWGVRKKERAEGGEGACNGREGGEWEEVRAKIEGEREGEGGGQEGGGCEGGRCEGGRGIREEGEDGREGGGRKDDGEAKKRRKERKKVEDLGNKLDKELVWKIDLKIEREEVEREKNVLKAGELNKQELLINYKVELKESSIYELYSEEEKKIKFPQID